MRESGEDYLETIYILSKRFKEVHAADVAAELGFSKPSVTRATHILEADGYIEFDEHKHIILTKKGLSAASEIFERHQIITEFLTLIGVRSDIAAFDACRMEHDVSEETFFKIKEFVAKNS